MSLPGVYSFHICYTVYLQKQSIDLIPTIFCLHFHLSFMESFGICTWYIKKKWVGNLSAWLCQIGLCYLRCCYGVWPVSSSYIPNPWLTYDIIFVRSKYVMLWLLIFYIRYRFLKFDNFHTAFILYCNFISNFLSAVADQNSNLSFS